MQETQVRSLGQEDPLVHTFRWLTSNTEIQEMGVQFLDQQDALEKVMATHSSILAWRLPQTEEPGGL